MTGRTMNESTMNGAKTGARSWAPRALFNVGWRYLLSRRWQSFLMIFGIALGVAVVVSIDLANASAGRAFALSTETVTGKTTHQIVGGSQGVDEKIYTDIKRQRIADLAAPVIDQYITSPQLDNQPMQLLGIDPFADAPFRRFLGQPSNGGLTSGQTAAAASIPDMQGLTAFFTRPGAVLISKQLAGRYGLKPGDALTLVIGGYKKQAFVAGLLVPDNDLSQRTLDGLILADISTAQELTGMLGRLDRIDLILPENDPAAVQRIASWLPTGYRVMPSSARTGTIQQMSEAFQLNLTALSLLALVVGLFLIYNTMTFSVVQRRGLFGTLRCLGVTRREIFALVLSEAFLVGLLGGLLGIGLGLALGQITVRMVTQTVNDLYFTTTVRSVGISAASLVKGALLGLLATVLTAALPAWEAATVPPRAALLRSGLEARARRSTGWSALVGLLVIGLGVGLFAIPSKSVALGFTGTLLVVVGFALFSAGALVALMRGLAPVTGRLFGLIGRMAPRNLVNSLSRTAVAVAALMVAVAVIIGVALMIDSFRYTVVAWLEQTLQGDVYISVPSLTATTSSTGIDPKIIDMVRTYPGVARVDTLRSASADSSIGPVNIAATENPHIGSERLFAALEIDRDAVWNALQSGGVLISEPLANRMGIRKPGGEIRLYTGHGWRSFRVQGIYYDYASSEGTVLMALDVYRKLWQDNTLTALGLRLQPGVSADQVTQGLQDRLAGQQQLLIRPNVALRRDVMVVFDRTFAITVALRVLATGVAFIGVLNALLLLQMEKQREVGILRALGLSGAQLRRLVLVETGLMGLAAGLLAMPTGYALSLILVYVINRRSFGWTLQMAIQPGTFLQALAVAIVAALLAGVYPAMKMSRMATAEVIRNE
jgi:putative ABC transport system permease protein